MKFAWLVVVLLNLAACAVMADAVLRIADSNRGTSWSDLLFDTLWMAFHLGPCVALAILAIASRQLRLRAIPIALVIVTLLVIVPGLVVARDDAASKPESFSLLHGIRTILVVCAEHVAVFITAVVAFAVMLVMHYRRRQREEAAWGHSSAVAPSPTTVRFLEKPTKA